MNLVNPSDKNQLAYLQQLPDGMITQSSVSNTNDLNNANALAQLALIEQNWLDPKSVGSYDPNNSVSYDTSRFKNDLALKRNEYEKARMNLTTSYDNQYDRGGNIFQADVDDLIGLYGRYLQDYARGSDSKLFYNPNRAVNGTITLDPYSRDNYLKYYNQAVDAVKNLNQQMGQTDVLKAGRDNEYGDMSQYTKDDLMLGWKAYEPGIADWRDPNDAKNFELHEKLGHLQEGNLKGKPNTTGVASSAWGWGGRYYDKGSGEAMNPIKETWDQYFERLRRGDYSAVPGITFTK
ncbi:MAG: hypothetical protein EBR82_78185 [Caulobacteraceae bacterium]|nr:hypothetical protein [Caulobacteraceae bacterium]